MASDGILAFLADRFNVRSREELATEGLSYLLQEYQAVHDTVINALASVSITPEIRTDIAFIGQARSPNDRWIVDLEGRINERVYISIEGKLDAPLQPSQPVDYARRLQNGGSLVFVCPSRRIPRLRTELSQRAADAGLLEANALWKQGVAEISWIALVNQQLMGVASWASLLKLVRDEAGGSSPALRADLYQLERLVAKYEFELEPWTLDELRKGGLGSTFAKALLTTRAVCGIFSAQMGASIKPAWATTTSDIRVSQDFWDWYGGKVGLPEPIGGLLAISFEPLHWGQDDVSSPIRLWFLVRGLSNETIERLYPVYAQMVTRANELLNEKLGAGPALARNKSEDWWMVPFPLSPELAGEEARDDMTNSAKYLLEPLFDLITGPSSKREI